MKLVVSSASDTGANSGLGPNTHSGIKYKSSKSNILLFQISIQIQISNSNTNTLPFFIQIPFNFWKFDSNGPCFHDSSSVS